MSANLRLIICSELVEPEKVCPAQEAVDPPNPEVVQKVRRETDKAQTIVDKLFPAMLGLGLAMLFGLMAHAVYGTMGLRQELWVVVVIGVISLTGVLISMLQFSPPAWLAGRFRKFA